MNIRFSLEIFLLLIIFVIPSQVLAYYYESATAGDLQTSVYPSNFGANQKITVSLASYLVNLNSCNIAWQQEGKPSEGGIGQKSFSFTTGKLGQIVSISTTLNCPSREPIIKKYIFQVNDIDFLISADTYVPPFYRGNSRVTPKSNVKIVALPQVFGTTGEILKPETLIYKWTRNGKAMLVSSGYGKNSITVPANDMIGNARYELEISSLAGEIKATKSVNVPVGNPEVILYESKPLVGVQYQKGLGELFTLDQNETTLIAEPFFFSNSDIANDHLSFDWTMNAKKIPPSANSRSITLRQNEGQTGEATIGLKVNNSINIFSVAQKTLKINFGQRSSLFGF